MFKRKLNYEIVPESDFTDFNDRYEKEKRSPSNGALITAATAATASLATYAVTKYTNPTIASTPIPPTIETIIEPVNVLSQIPPTIPIDTIPVNFGNAMTPEMIPTGLIGETSLTMLANVLDPLIQILVAISFPIASVIMVGACFFFMLGNSEKAWQTIFNAGLGYVLIQMSPLFLAILKEIGKAI